MNPYIALLIGLILGALIGYFLASSKHASAEERASSADRLVKENSELQKELTDLKSQLAAANASIEKERESWIEKQKILEEATARLENTFKALSSEALKSNNQSFLQLAKETLGTFQEKATGDLTAKEKAIETLVKPLKDSLEKYEKQVVDLDKSREGEYKVLKDQVESLLKSEQSLQKETIKLINALSAPQVRGRWGEITLRRVAELAGMSEHCDFIEQESTDTAAGRFRPDMIVNLPQGRRVIIDAKTPFQAFVEASEATTDDGRKAKLVEHSRQVKTCMTNLCRKEYKDQYKDTADFVILFLPGEQFLGAAMVAEPGLLDEALSKGVMIATPSTLIAILKGAEFGWRQDALANNAIEIRELGSTLYDRLSSMLGYLMEVGRSLDKGVESYNKAVGSLESRVIVTARKFKELGATGKDGLPELQQIEHTTRQITIPVGYDVEP